MFVISAAVPSLVLSADVAVRKQAQARQALLVRELQHRTKNLLAVVQSIVNNTMAHSRDLASASDAIGGRLQALARAQDYLVSGPSDVVPMRDIVVAELAAFGSRIRFEGGALDIGSALGRKLALVLHELATNAAKYGSLSIPDGRVLISWRVEPSSEAGTPCLKFSWVERDRPALLGRPADHGFGMQLIAALLGHTPRVSFRESGLEFAALKCPCPRSWRTTSDLRLHQAAGSAPKGIDRGKR